ncbi:hypothetical protein Bca4012_096255 [Brassica carinata]
MAAAIDGCFNLKLAFETLSERFPKLAAFPFFNQIIIHTPSSRTCTIDATKIANSIIKEIRKRATIWHQISRGRREVVDSEDVINALSDVFLHPDTGYTPVLEDAMKEGVSVIDFYVRRGQRLELHECACLAFSRALHLKNTSLLGSVLKYFKEAPPPCELLTTRPSQELAEQLRLVLEPTIASKLSGDYRTGKRINMKKVIPYIASHYRKDKIWLRRTKPNKRDYQVLEMGSLAVASFGKEGSIKMLHDFDQSFTTESGIKMISGLTFKQENLIRDEPVANLLRNMNEMLENLASTRRHSPLQQLVLIIGDGKFHEREKLKRSVRKFLQQKRMVVYILLDDNAEQSVLDLVVVVCTHLFSTVAWL